MAPVVALHDQLVCTCDQREAVVVVELLRDVLAERVAGAARRDAPAAAIVRIRPQQIAHRTLVRHLLDAIQRADVLERIDRRRQATVQAKDLTEKTTQRINCDDGWHMAEIQRLT